MVRELGYPISVVVQVLEVEGHLVHGVAIFVCFLKGAPGAGLFDVTQLIENIVQEECGGTAFLIIDLCDDALAEKIETDLRRDAFVGNAILILDVFEPIQNVFLYNAFVDGIIPAIGRQRRLD